MVERSVKIPNQRIAIGSQLFGSRTYRVQLFYFTRSWIRLISLFLCVYCLYVSLCCTLCGYIVRVCVYLSTR